MKIRIFTLLLVALLLSGCGESAMERTVDTVEAGFDRGIPAAPAAQPTAPKAMLTEQEAVQIALDHVGFTADQVRGLRTEYEVDDGVEQYDVQFYEGRWEYEFEIDAYSGKILSFDKDD